jgi:acetyl esterase/lipase
LIPLASIALLFFLSALPVVAKPQANIITYKTPASGDPLTLHVFSPDGNDITVPKPGIVLFFGGGWKQGAPGAMYRQAQYFAERGIIAISAQYRTKSSHDVFPDVCVMDGRSAMRYVRTHAKELGIDPDRLLAGGGSAGGHVAACAALPGAPDDPTDDSSVSPRPAALVLFNPVLDVGPEGYAHGYVKYNTPDWESICPVLKADKTFPPHLILFGSEDKILPIPMVENFQKTIQKQGVRCDLEIYQGQGHGFFNRPPYLEQTLERADTFLTELGYLSSKTP